MARDLSSGNYSHAEILAQLASPTRKLSARFDIEDSNSTVLDSLDGVLSATVEMNVDREIKGSLTLSLLPQDVGDPFTKRIRPYFILETDNGDIAEYAMGVYLWSVPERQIVSAADTTLTELGVSTGMEVWSMTLPDLGFILSQGGPGISGFSVSGGSLFSSGIASAATAAGLTDLTGISATTATFSQAIAWDLVTSTSANTPNTREATSWFRILQDIHTMAGFYGPWFDLDGIYQAISQPNLTTATPGISYAGGTNSLLIQPVTTRQELNSFANRVIARSNSAGSESYMYSTADANSAFPNHPLRQSVIGFYIDQIITDSGTTATVDLESSAQAQLARALTRYQTIELTTLANPAHEAFDIVGLTIEDDSEFASEEYFHEGGWQMNLMSGTMSHNLRRVVR